MRLLSFKCIRFFHVVLILSLERVYGAECDKKFFFMCEGSTELITQPMKFDDAHKYCEKKGGLLTSSDYDQLNSLFGDQDFPIWIGLQRDGKDKHSCYSFVN